LTTRRGANVPPSGRRGRRVRVDAADLARVQHPLLIAMFALARGGTAYRQVADGRARPLVLNRVA
jgi:hypothetical protein